MWVKAKDIKRVENPPTVGAPRDVTNPVEEGIPHRGHEAAH